MSTVPGTVFRHTTSLGGEGSDAIVVDIKCEVRVEDVSSTCATVFAAILVRKAGGSDITEM